MAISKIQYKSSPSATPTVWMDVTGKTVTAGAMRSGVTALKNDGTDVTGNIADITLPSSASSTASGTSKATITPTSSAQYLNIPTGYNATAQYYTIAAASGGGGSDLRSLTVEPKPYTQEFSGDTAWSISKSTSIPGTYSGSAAIRFKLGISYSDIPLTTNTSYSVTGSFVRTGKSRTYTADTTVTWSGSGTTISFSEITATFGTAADNTVILDFGVTSIDEDSSTNYLELSFESNSPFDGYDTVTVQPMPHNMVTGTFKGTSTGSALTVNIPYYGNGYPLAVMIFPEEGPYNSSTGTFYSTIQRYAISYYCMMKSRQDVIPTYATTGSDERNFGTSYLRYKNSTSSATNYNGSASNGAATVYRSTSASSGTSDVVRITSGSTMSVYIASTSYGFMANITYRYIVLYSS